jgi:hypothetical protein
VSEDDRSQLVDLVQHLNRVARSVIEEDGEHAAMFFLLVGGGNLEAHLFSEATERPVGEARGREVAEAVEATGADAVVSVSEAWSAAADAVPADGGAGDAADARDVLLVAGIDRAGNTIVLETPVTRLADGSVELGDAEEHQAGYAINFLAPVRTIWSLES